MNDHELLEFAANAAGIDYHLDYCDGCAKLVAYGAVWNPLTNDGDALRLAVKLGLDIEQKEDGVYALGFDPVANFQLIEWHKNDRCAATRWAIVKAAAEI